jgi:hypothetical protein
MPFERFARHRRTGYGSVISGGQCVENRRLLATRKFFELLAYSAESTPLRSKALGLVAKRNTKSVQQNCVCRTLPDLFTPLDERLLNFLFLSAGIE